MMYSPTTENNNLQENMQHSIKIEHMTSCYFVHIKFVLYFKYTCCCNVQQYIALLYPCCGAQGFV